MIVRGFKFIFVLAALLILAACGGTQTPDSTLPTNVVATPGPGLITVSWQYTGSDATGFKIFREEVAAASLAPLAADEIATVGSDKTSYQDMNVNSGSNYRYAVAVVRESGTSEQVWQAGGAVSPDSGFQLSVFFERLGGSVSSNPSGIACSVSGATGCQASFAEGSMVTLSATANQGFGFAGWGTNGLGDCSGVDDCTLAMDKSKVAWVEFGGLPVIDDFSADPDMIDPDDSTTLSWTVTGAESLSIDNGVGDVTGQSSISVNPSISTTYELTATNKYGGSSSQTTVTVGDAPVITIFKADDTSVTSGSPVELSWTVAGEAPITLTLNDGTTDTDVTGLDSITVNPTATTTYTLTASSGFGSDTDTLLVTVGTAPTINSFTADDTTVTSGSDVTLSWTVTDADSLSIDSGVGTVTGSSTIVNPTTTTTYTLTATNVYGSTDSTPVTVTVGTAPSISSFTATPDTIATGGSSTLAWTVTGDGTISLSIDNGVGDVTGTSNTSVSPDVTTTYELTASSEFGAPATATVTVTVN